MLTAQGFQESSACSAVSAQGRSTPPVSALGSSYTLAYRVWYNGGVERSSGNPAPLSRWERAFLFWVAGLMVATRLPFATRLLYHWDSVQFALAMDEYNVVKHQPHPPGYFLYVMAGRLVHLLVPDANAALVTLSILAGAAAAPLLYLLARRLSGAGAAAAATLFFATSPVVWLYGEVALSDIVEGCAVTGVALLCWRARAGSRRDVLLSALALGIAGGFRQQSLPLLLPLWLYAAWPHRWRLLLVGAALGAAAVVAWAVPMVLLSGGARAYAEAVAYVWRSMHGAAVVRAHGVGALLDGAGLVLAFCLQALSLAVVPLGIWAVHAVAARRRRTPAGAGEAPTGLAAQARAAARGRPAREIPRESGAGEGQPGAPAGAGAAHPGRPARAADAPHGASPAVFLAIWIGFPLAFYVGASVIRAGILMTIYPALFLLAGAAAARPAGRLSPRRPDRARRVLAGSVMALNAALFFLPGATPSVWGLRQHDTALRERVAAVRRHFPPAETLISTRGQHLYRGFRLAAYYLPEYRVVEEGWPERPRWAVGHAGRVTFRDRLDLTGVRVLVIFDRKDGLPPGLADRAAGARREVLPLAHDEPLVVYRRSTSALPNRPARSRPARLPSAAASL